MNTEKQSTSTNKPEPKSEPVQPPIPEPPKPKLNASHNLVTETDQRNQSSSSVIRE